MDVGRTGFNGTSGNGREARSTSGSADPHVQEVLKSAHDELRGLLKQRAEIMKRIGTVKQTIVGLANMFGDEVLNEELLELVDRKSNGRQPGFTKACRMVLMEAGRPLGADSTSSAATQGSTCVGDDCTKPAGGLRRGAHRCERERTACLAMGVGTRDCIDTSRRARESRQLLTISPWDESPPYDMAQPGTDPSCGPAGSRRPLR
jgi:hypothetical protein